MATYCSIWVDHDFLRECFFKYFISPAHMQAAGDKYYISTLEGLGEGEALHGVTKGRKGPFFKDNVILAHSDIMWELSLIHI